MEPRDTSALSCLRSSKPVSAGERMITVEDANRILDNPGFARRVAAPAAAAGYRRGQAGIIPYLENESCTPCRLRGESTVRRSRLVRHKYTIAELQQADWFPLLAVLGLLGVIFIKGRR